MEKDKPIPSTAVGLTTKVKNTLFGSRRRTIITVIALAVIVFLIRQQFAATTTAPAYQTTAAARGTIVSTVSTSGQVMATGRLPILSQASGEVTAVYVKNGDKVIAGQKILSMTLDPGAAAKNAAAWSSYLSAKTNLDSANATAFSLDVSLQTAWQTFYSLATNGTYQNSDGSPKTDIRNGSAEFNTDQANFQAAEAKYKNQQAVINQAQAAINSSWQSYQQTSPDLTAPSTGTIQDLTYVPGMLISSSISSSGITQSQTIASVLTTASPSITVNLSEIDVNKVLEGDKATLTFDAITGKTFTGKVVGINKTGVVSSGVTNYPATIQLDTDPTEVLPNMSASANIIVATKSDVITVPSAAIQTQNSQSVVRVLQKGQSVSVPVETGISSDTDTEIVSGVSEGDQIITGVASSTSQSGSSSSPFSSVRLGGFGGGGGGGSATGRRPGG